MTAVLTYCLLYAAAGLSGLPFGFRLFGRRHPAGWVAGALIGYALTAIALWAVIRSGSPSFWTFVAGWAIVSALVWITAGRPRDPLIALTQWGRADSIAFALFLALTLAIAIPPFAKLGIRDAGGNQYYRAYFTADFVWHTALTAEVGKFSMPPRNPFLRARPIHYYWAYYLLPASVSSTGPAAVRDVETCLKLNAILTGVLFMSALFMSIRAAVPSAMATGISASLALVASSAEAWARLGQIWTHGWPLDSLRQTNIDAVTAWVWNGYRVDGLQRAIWYNPQHSMAGALGLVALGAAAAGGSAASVASGLLVGLALAGSVAMNPFVGSLFALAYGVTAVIHAFTQSDPIRRIVRSAAAVIPVAAALAWCVGNQMVEGAGGALEFGFGSLSRNAPLLTLMLSLGPALAPAVAGLFARGGGAFIRLIPSATLAGVSLFLMYFVRLSVDEYWVGFRTGHLMLVSLPALTARFFTWAFDRSRAIAFAAIAIVLLAGAPTLLVDAYNAQDLTNREIGAGGFPWTRLVTPAEQEAYKWIRRMTPKDAVVQQDAMARFATSWWVVPMFGQRRMAAGLPPFLLNVPEYGEKSALVQKMYATPNPAEAHDIANRLGIDYVFIDAVERHAYGAGLDKFEDIRFFSPAFRNQAVAIYRVQ